MTTVVVARHGGRDAGRLAPVVSRLYRAVFTLPPFLADDAAMAGQCAHYERLVRSPGFRLALATAGTEPIGFGYGAPLVPGSTWWAGLDRPLDDSFTSETGSRTFAIIDYGVLPGWRGRGVGRAVHDGLLRGCGAERATLSVRPAAARTQAIYRHLGWRRVGRMVAEPSLSATGFDVLVLEPVPGGEGGDGTPP